MNTAQRKALAALFADPVSMTQAWRRIDALLLALGAQVIEGHGSRVKFILNGELASFHRAHPDKEAKPYQVRDVRAFLTHAGIKP